MLLLWGKGPGGSGGGKSIFFLTQNMEYLDLLELYAYQKLKYFKQRLPKTCGEEIQNIMQHVCMTVKCGLWI